MLRRLGIALGIAMFLLWGIGGAIDTQEALPDHAIVLTLNGRYYPGQADIAVKRLSDANPDDLNIMTAGEAKRLGYPPDEICAERGDFIGAKSTLLRSWLQRFGIPAPSRWNKDGTWRW